MLTTLKLTDFRNYASGEVSLCPALNVVVGENGSGKTSLLEAVYFIGSGGRSFRGGRLSRLVKEGADAAVLYAELADGENTHRLGIRRAPSGIDSLKLNGQTPGALSEVAALLPVLALHPGSVELVYGGSSLRRRFLDWGMFHVEHAFLLEWRTGSAALKQRNALLKKGASGREMAYWNQQLSQSSARIEGLRRAYLQRLEPAFNAVLSMLSPDLSVRLRLHTGLEPKESYEQALARLHDEDVRRGFTHAGFHRADIKIESAGRIIKDKFSRGQAKLVAYALMLAQLPLIAEAGKVCTLLVDDLAAELDELHRQRLFDYLMQTGHQVIVTALDAAQWDAKGAEGQEIRMFHVEHGRIAPYTNNE